LEGDLTLIRHDNLRMGNVVVRKDIPALVEGFKAVERIV
jgi:hypothetical protein